MGWYLTDRLGSVRHIVGGTGADLYRSDYTLLGNSEATTGTGGDRFGFTSREFEPAIGLQFNRARAYDPTWGRWTSEDPIGFAGGDYNLYRYVGNASTNLTDPSGLAPPGFGLGQSTTSSNSSNVPALDPQSAAIAALRAMVVNKVGENSDTGLTHEEMASTDWDAESLIGWYILYKGSAGMAKIASMQSQGITISTNPHSPMFFGKFKDDIFVGWWGFYASWFDDDPRGRTLHISKNEHPGRGGWFVNDSTIGKDRTLLSALNILDHELDKLLCEDNPGASFFLKLNLSGRQLRDWQKVLAGAENGELENLKDVDARQRADLATMGNMMAEGVARRGKEQALAWLASAAGFASIGLLKRTDIATKRVKYAIKPDPAQALKYQAFKDRIANFKRKVSPSELVDADTEGGRFSPGHAWGNPSIGHPGHGVPKSTVSGILNNPETIFHGTYEKTGRLTDIYYKDGTVVVTQAGRKHSIITAYGKAGNEKKAVKPELWRESGRVGHYVEIDVNSSGAGIQTTFPAGTTPSTPGFEFNHE